MFIVDETTGNITLRQGDNGKYSIFGLPTDKNYRAYLSVEDENRNKIGEELSVETNNSDSVSFIFSPDFTDNFTVKRGEDFATYYFGIKICYGINDIEDTLIIGDKTIEDVNTITVLPKITEGNNI